MHALLLLHHSSVFLFFWSVELGLNYILNNLFIVYVSLFFLKKVLPDAKLGTGVVGCF